MDLRVGQLFSEVKGIFLLWYLWWPPRTSQILRLVPAVYRETGHLTWTPIRYQR